MAAITLKSNTDTGDRDGTGSYWQIDFNLVDMIDETDTANLKQLTIARRPATQAIVDDYDGTGRTININGSRVNGELNNGVSMTNAAWILLIRERLNGMQRSKGPFRLVKTSSPAAYIPQETTTCYINKFRWQYLSSHADTILWDLQLTVGR